MFCFFSKKMLHSFIWVLWIQKFKVADVFDVYCNTNFNSISDLQDILDTIPPKNWKLELKADHGKKIQTESIKMKLFECVELFRMGDEKEAVMGQLQTERRQYEKQVLQLVNQQEQILTEREGKI